MGHSFGGAAVLQAALELPSVRAVATIAAPYDPAHVQHVFRDSLDEIEERGSARVRIGEREFTLSRDFVHDLEAQNVDEALARLERALLVLHSPVDRIVDIRNAARIYQAAKHPKSFVSLENADHLLSDEADSRYAGTVIAAWASRYLPPREEEPEPESDRVVTRTGPEHYRTEVQARGHTMVADEPKSLGGEDLGPTPYDLLVAGLGACTGMTLRMYADRKEWPLEEVVVRLRHRKIHAQDCEECETQDAKIDRIEREIDVVGELDDEQRARLLEIANRCPVHRTLEGEISVVSKLRDVTGALDASPPVALGDGNGTEDEDDA